MSKTAEVVDMKNRKTEPEPEPETTALAAKPPATLGPPSSGEWNIIAQISNQVNDTDFVPRGLRGKPGAVLACILSGRELGIGPMQALQSIQVVDGRPNLSAELMRALVRRRGHYIAVVRAECNAERAVVEGKRVDTGQYDRATYTIDDAITAKLCARNERGEIIARSQNGAPLAWEKFTRFMLVARATSELVGTLFEDVCAGISYTADELTDGAIVAPADVGGQQPEPAEESLPQQQPEPEPAHELTPEEQARRALWTVCRTRWGDAAEAKLRSAIAPRASTKELGLDELRDLLHRAEDPEWEPVEQTLGARLRAAAQADWAPSEQDAKLSGDPVEERRVTLLMAADMADEFDLDDEQMGALTGFASPLRDLAISSLRKCSDRLEAFAAEREAKPDHF